MIGSFYGIGILIISLNGYQSNLLKVIAQKNGGSRPKAVEGGCFPPQYVHQ